MRQWLQSHSSVPGLLTEIFFVVEFDKQQWTSLYVFIICWSIFLRWFCRRRKGRKKWRLLIVSFYFCSVPGPGRAILYIALLTYLRIRRQDLHYWALHCWEKAEMRWSHSLTVQTLSKILIRWDIMARLCSYGRAFKVRRQQYCTVSFSALQMV